MSKMLLSLILRFLFYEEKIAYSINAKLNKSVAIKFRFFVVLKKSLGKVRLFVLSIIERTPGLMHMKLTRDLNAAADFFELCNTIEVGYFLSGGVAYNAILFGDRNIMRYSDIDVVVLDADLQLISERLTEKGWLVDPLRRGLIVAKESTKVDIFAWYTDGEFARIEVEEVPNMPVKNLEPQTIQLFGIEYNIASKAFIEGIFSAIKKKKSIRNAKSIIES